MTAPSFGSLREDGADEIADRQARSLVLQIDQGYRLCQVREEEFGGPNLREAAARGEWVAVSSRELGPDPDDHIRYFVRMQAEDISNDLVGVDPRSTHGTSIDTAVELMELREKIYQAALYGEK